MIHVLPFITTVTVLRHLNHKPHIYLIILRKWLNIQILHGTYLKQGRSKTNLLLSSSSWNAKSHLQEKWTHKFFKKETLHAISSGGGTVKSLVLAPRGNPVWKSLQVFQKRSDENDMSEKLWWWCQGDHELKPLPQFEHFKIPVPFCLNVSMITPGNI